LRIGEIMECLHRKDDLIPRSRQSKGPNRGEVMPDQTHARSEAIETRTRKLQHRVGAVDPDERRLGSASRTASDTSPEPTPRSSTAPSPTRAPRSRATRISGCSARVASPSLAPASHCRAVSLCCHTPKPYSGEVADLRAQAPVETPAPLTPERE